jgi:hypothetical protein
MNANDECVKQYHEYLRNLCGEVSEICEDSRYILGKHATVRWDILVQLIQEQEYLYQIKIELFDWMYNFIKYKSIEEAEKFKQEVEQYI